jgi:serine/threonine-protein kinase
MLREENSKWEIIHTLGNQRKRKIGTVSVVKNRENDELAILKQCQKTHTSLPLQELLRKESRFTFAHQGLPFIREFRENEVEIQLILKYQEGIPLNEFWQEIPKKKRTQMVKELVSHLAPLLRHLREHQIVHCDLKPSNILVKPASRSISLSLLDFGMAIVETEANSRPPFYPLGYAAPELLLNRLDLVDHRTDIYSLGILLWQLFVGKLPLTHQNPAVFSHLQLVHPLPYSSEIPKEIWPIIQKMCVKHPFRTAPHLMDKTEITSGLKQAMQKRFSNISEVAQAFEDLKTRKKWFHF